MYAILKDWEIHEGIFFPLAKVSEQNIVHRGANSILSEMTPVRMDAKMKMAALFFMKTNLCFSHMQFIYNEYNEYDMEIRIVIFAEKQKQSTNALVLTEYIIMV